MITPENSRSITEAMVEQLKQMGADAVTLALHFPTHDCKCGKADCGARVVGIDGEAAELVMLIRELFERTVPDADKRARVLQLMLMEAYAPPQPPHYMRQRGADA